MAGFGTRAWFFLRWGVYYNLELMWLQSRAPAETKDGRRAPRSAGGAEMDGRRRQAQLEVYEVTNAYGSICASCGNCCREATDRFSVMDAAVRADTDRPAPSFGTTLLSPVWELWNTVRHTAIRLASLGRPKVAMDKCKVCAHLTPTGCELALEDRPMICATWFCPRLMAAMSPTDLLQISKPMAVIEDIQREAVKDLRGPKR